MTKIPPLLTSLAILTATTVPAVANTPEGSSVVFAPRPGDHCMVNNLPCELVATLTDEAYTQQLPKQGDDSPGRYNTPVGDLYQDDHGQVVATNRWSPITIDQDIIINQQGDTRPVRIPGRQLFTTASRVSVDGMDQGTINRPTRTSHYGPGQAVIEIEYCYQCYATDVTKYYDVHVDNDAANIMVATSPQIGPRLNGGHGGHRLLVGFTPTKPGKHVIRFTPRPDVLGPDGNPAVDLPEVTIHVEPDGKRDFSPTPRASLRASDTPRPYTQRHDCTADRCEVRYDWLRNNLPSPARTQAPAYNPAQQRNVRDGSHLYKNQGFYVAINNHSPVSIFNTAFTRSITPNLPAAILPGRPLLQLPPGTDVAPRTGLDRTHIDLHYGSGVVPAANLDDFYTLHVDHEAKDITHELISTPRGPAIRVTFTPTQGGDHTIRFIPHTNTVGVNFDPPVPIFGTTSHITIPIIDPNPPAPKPEPEPQPQPQPEPPVAPPTTPAPEPEQRSQPQPPTGTTTPVPPPAPQTPNQQPPEQQGERKHDGANGTPDRQDQTQQPSPPSSQDQAQTPMVQAPDAAQGQQDRQAPGEQGAGSGHDAQQGDNTDPAPVTPEPPVATPADPPVNAEPPTPPVVAHPEPPAVVLPAPPAAPPVQAPPADPTPPGPPARPVPPTEPPKCDRPTSPAFDTLYGTTRHHTAVNAMRALYGEHHQFDQVFLSRDDNPVDTQGAIPLAVNHRAPIIQTNRDQLTPDTATFLERHAEPGRTIVHVLGGTQAVSDQVIRQVTELGYTVVRRGGATRVETLEGLYAGTGMTPINVQADALTPDVLMYAAMYQRAPSYLRGDVVTPGQTKHLPTTAGIRPGDLVTGIYYTAAVALTATSAPSC